MKSFNVHCIHVARTCRGESRGPVLISDFVPDEFDANVLVDDVAHIHVRGHLF
jgi:hypothetical protein